ncbi:alpha/beta fold hydrolase [Microbispora sp. CSR-4]|uniref:alpha/beta fold hydrolase n=1 Tax=Microbispora sp. CSR-4 TaxID=2592813 RepID=UPI001C9C4A6E|nr:alpha/beta hydrolase [Microbispora sp. CSR-4]
MGRPASETTAPPLGRLYDVGERRLMLHRSGSGGSSVVFLPGAGLVGLDFLNVQEGAAAFATSVLYDRGGTGWSEPAPLPRRATEVAAELRGLLRATAVPGPFLLVGHSLGAFYARRYAQLFPDDVAGLLLLDPGHEDILDHMPAQAADLAERMRPDAARMPELTGEQRWAARGAYARLYAEWPAPVREALIGHHLASWRTSLRETENFETEVYDELRAGGPLPDVPLIVLTAGGVNPYWAKFLPEEVMREAHDGVRALHAAMARSVPRGRQRVVDGASHQYLHVERADEVLRAIRDLMTAI